MDVERFYDSGYALLDRLDRRLGPSGRELTREFLDAGEWALFVEELAAELTQDRTPIDATERDLLHALLYSFELEESEATHHPIIGNRDEVMGSLNVVDVTRRAS